jgi:hypothetical protein
VERTAERLLGHILVSVVRFTDFEADPFSHPAINRWAIVGRPLRGLSPDLFRAPVRTESVSSLCDLCVLCVSVVNLLRGKNYHSDTEVTEDAQRLKNALLKRRM